MPATYQDSASSTGPTITKPAGVVAGDLLLAILYHDNTVTTPPDGFVQIGAGSGADNNTSRIRLYTKTAGASEPASYTWTMAPSSSAVPHLYRIANGGTPTVTWANQTTASTTHTAPSVTGAVDALLISVWGCSGFPGATYTTAAATEQEDVSDDWLTLASATTNLTAAGATGTKAATSSVSRTAIVGSIVVPFVASTAPPPAASRSLTGLTPARDYDARVRAVNADGPSPWSTAFRFTTAPASATRATKLNAANMSGPYYTPIPANPVLDPNSASKVATITARNKYAGLMWVTTFFAVPADPSYSIVYDLDPEVQTGGAYAWAKGNASYRAEEVEPVRIPNTPNFYVQPGGYADGSGWDGWGCIVDPARNLGWAGWRMVKVSGQWQAATSHSFPLDTLATRTYGLGRGDGLPAIAGSITVQEAAAAAADPNDTYVIPHALAVSLPGPLIDTNFRAPATKTDGAITPTTSTISEGSRFYLPSTSTSPSTTATPLGRFYRALWRTLKTYGLYVVDRNGPDPAGAMMINFERFDPANPTDVVVSWDGAATTPANPLAIAGAYYRAGLQGDYFNLGTGVPWADLRLLRQWDGA